MGADDVHGANLHNDAAGFANFGNGAIECYKTTVNESETITNAQPLCPVRGRGPPSMLRGSGFGFPVAPHIERS